MDERERKEGKTELQKFQYLENKNSFLDKIKNIFYDSLRTFIV